VILKFLINLLFIIILKAIRLFIIKLIIWKRKKSRKN